MLAVLGALFANGLIAILKFYRRRDYRVDRIGDLPAAIWPTSIKPLQHT